VFSEATGRPGRLFFSNREPHCSGLHHLSRIAILNLGNAGLVLSRSPVPTVWQRLQVAIVDTFGVGDGAEKDRADYAAVERKFDLLDAFTRASGYAGHEDYSDRMWGIASLQL
jgi:hypothetical protein